MSEMERKDRSRNRNEDARRKIEGYPGVRPQVKESED